MKIAERVVMVALALVFLGGAAWVYFSVQYKEQSMRDAVARGEYEIYPDDKEKAAEDDVDNKKNWREYYPELVPIVIGSTTMQASVADSLPERIKGLSDTPYLPDNVVKLFAFGTAGTHSIWMKDMNYPIDIIWVAKDGKIIHFKENAQPSSSPSPESYSSPTPAWYVIEANAGFVASTSLKIGDKVIVPVFE